jgi:uncharacterized Zn-finger protein
MSQTTPNSKNRYEVTEADLPLRCPMPQMSLWNSHPRVFLTVKESGKAKCPYSGAEFIFTSNKKVRLLTNPCNRLS